MLKRVVKCRFRCRSGRTSHLIQCGAVASELPLIVHILCGAGSSSGAVASGLMAEEKHAGVTLACQWGAG